MVVFYFSIYVQRTRKLLIMHLTTLSILVEIMLSKSPTMSVVCITEPFSLKFASLNLFSLYREVLK